MRLLRWFRRAFEDDRILIDLFATPASCEDDFLRPNHEDLTPEEFAEFLKHLPSEPVSPSPPFETLSNFGIKRIDSTFQPPKKSLNGIDKRSIQTGSFHNSEGASTHSSKACCHNAAQRSFESASSPIPDGAPARQQSFEISPGLQIALKAKKIAEANAEAQVKATIERLLCSTTSDQT